MVSLVCSKQLTPCPIRLWQQCLDNCADVVDASGDDDAVNSDYYNDKHACN